MRIASIFATAVLVFVSLFGQAQSSSVIQQAHKTTYHIMFETYLEAAECSATAVGPHALLTATHCELGSDSIEIEGDKDPVHIEGHIRDDHDHTIFLLSGITFHAYSQIDIKNSISQGDEVFLFGNPGNWGDVFRKGYLTGRQQGPFDQNAEYIFDIRGWNGDSGAALFDDKGRIAAVLTGELASSKEIGSLRLPFSLDFAFKQCDIDVAQQYGVGK